MKKTQTRLIALVLAAALLLTSCGGGSSAATMHLRKTEGTVGVSDSEGKDIAPKNNLGLYSGYQVGTQAESYAWIDLDRVKLAKLDAGSEIEIVKENKMLEIEVKSGSLFFNVAEPLADDESMNIRTSTMAVGIRGTCGWVTQDAAALLEGTVSVTAGDQEVTVNAGEMAVLTADGTLKVKPFTAAFVPTFVREEIADDDKLVADIQDTTGMDLTGSLEDAYPDVFRQIRITGGELLFAEEIDFEQDGSPELLLIHRNNQGVGWLYIYRRGPEGSEYLCGEQVATTSITIYMHFKISLVESEGRPYVLLYDYHSDPGSTTKNSETYYYLGSLAQNDGDSSYWGYVDRVWYSYGTGEAHEYASNERNEKGLTNGVYVESTAGEFEAVIQKYTEVRVLMSSD